MVVLVGGGPLSLLGVVGLVDLDLLVSQGDEVVLVEHDLGAEDVLVVGKESLGDIRGVLEDVHQLLVVADLGPVKPGPPGNGLGRVSIPALALTGRGRAGIGPVVGRGPAGTVGRGGRECRKDVRRGQAPEGGGGARGG